MEKFKGVAENERGSVDIDVERLETDKAYDYKGDEFSATSYQIKVTECEYRIIDNSLGLSEAQHIQEIESSLKDYLGLTKIRWSET